MGYLRLARPANLPTAAADILAGIAVSGFYGATFEPGFIQTSLLLKGLWLVLASVALYAGGVVFNDVFDAELDRVERPERPIPSGLVSSTSAAVFGSLLLLTGVFLAFLTHPFSGYIAMILTFAILLYDAYFKQFPFLGPLNMGVCRGLNLILGMSVAGIVLHWWYALIPVFYIFAITLISRGEVHGKNKKHLIWAALIYALVIFCVVYIVVLHPMQAIQVLLLLVLFAFMIYKPLVKAYRENNAWNIKKAVMAGVLSLIVLDAALAVIFTPWWYGFLILLLWPLSRMLSKLFAVT
jgi:4-hydroxybenzoate polyprenyltransferase